MLDNKHNQHRASGELSPQAARSEEVAIAVRTGLQVGLRIGALTPVAVPDAMRPDIMAADILAEQKAGPAVDSTLTPQSVAMMGGQVELESVGA